MYPVVVIAMPVPTLALAKVCVAVPPKVTVSPSITPDKAAVPLTVAVVVRSYTFEPLVKPEIVSSFRVTEKTMVTDRPV